MKLRTERLTRLATRTGLAVALALAVLALGVVNSEVSARQDQDKGKDDTPRKDGPPPQPKVKLGLHLNDPKAFQGYTLFAPLGSPSTYLMDMEGKVIRSWKSEYSPGASAYLLDNGHLLRTAALKEQPFGHTPGEGGKIQEFDWDGELIWDFKFVDEKHLPHHDATRLPNGNILMIVWDKKTPKEAIAAGRKPELAGDRPLQPDSLIEFKPTGKTTAEIVWEWHLWDHLIQDADSSKANFGDVAAHPELVDINFGEGLMSKMVANKDDLDKLKSLGYVGGSKDSKGQVKVNPDWTHVNGLDYNPELDQIIVSVHAFSEFWIIDHSTTTAEAASHRGGRSGRGGDLLYRWGNPMTYRAGKADDEKLFSQHNAHWIPEGLPGAGHVLVFNNGSNRPGAKYSTVDELVLPVDEHGQYTRKDGAAFGPDKPVWSYAAPKTSDFYSFFISGAQRLPNGDTLICSGANGTFFEVTPDKEIVWKYINPVKDTMGPGRGFGPPKLNEIMPFFVRDMLKLSPEQREKLDALQKVVDSGLEKLLNDDQKKSQKERQGQGPGPGGPGGPGGFTPPGQIMSLSTQITLKLTADQKQELKSLQKDVDGKLDEITTEDQKKQLKKMSEDFARGGPGRPGGPGGPPGGPGGRPGFPPNFGPPGGSPVFRAYRYAPDFAGLAGKVLTPGKTVEELQPEDDKPKAPETN